MFASISDGRAQGECVLNVGVNDSLYFFVDYQAEGTPDQANVCSLAQSAATDVIKNLQGGH